ncbi:hypothetical protein P22_1752 [Propionispora sp. 2/2-37]|uniref:SEC-C metal-binding domain-containing protein n=1 Tax=Propionispora sp. 2/2-37 TaxID=1677858 RepID=UPI0006BB64C6|nr:SEC-C metal-binding domain-containing protein [Propionispora sp. 2/2-37]CUH95676.1 hypothetical protein P22_1752 [Propionispora sp. 2/2-37]
MKIRVPQRMTKEIEALCRQINSCASPVFIPVDCPDTGDEEADCLANVARKMLEEGGDFQCGWAVWEWPEVMLEAEFWTVWVNPAGQWIDVTPRGRGNRLLFIADNQTKFQGTPINSIVKPMINHPLVREYVELNQTIWRQTDELTGAGKTDMEICEVVAPLIARKDALEQEIDQKLSGSVGRNDSCPCGSGKKFKKCCGH